MKKAVVLIVLLVLVGCDGLIYRFNLKNTEELTANDLNKRKEIIKNTLVTYSQCESQAIDKEKKPNTILNYQCRVEEGDYRGHLFVGVGLTKDNQIEIDLIDYPWQKRSKLSYEIEEKILSAISE